MRECQTRDSSEAGSAGAVGLEPCPRCGGEQIWATSHSQCLTCRWITPCCEGAALPARSQ